MKNLKKRKQENQQIHRAGGESGLWEEGIVSLRSKLVFGETSPPPTKSGRLHTSAEAQAEQTGCYGRLDSAGQAAGARSSVF